MKSMLQRSHADSRFNRRHLYAWTTLLMAVATAGCASLSADPSATRSTTPSSPSTSSVNVPMDTPATGRTAAAPTSMPAPPTAVTPAAASAVPPVPHVVAAPLPGAAQAGNGMPAPGATAADGTQPASQNAPEPQTPVDPLRPDVPVDMDDRSARQDLWLRIRQGFSVPTLDVDLVRKAEQMYAGKPDYMQRMTERGGRYLFHIVEEVQRRKLPTELALLPFVESAFNPEAMSHARASGMWQFMPATGRVFNLRQNVFRDDRRDVLASTRAALDYLTKLHGMFGDWHLALAAYNWGEGSVQRAINRNKASGLPTDYTSLSMPNETRFYIPKLQAIKNIVLNPTGFGLALPKLENHPYFLSVPIQRDIDVDLVAKLSNMGMADFKALNPQLNRPVILAAGTPQVLLPYDNANAFLKNLARHKGPSATWTAWTVSKTMRAADAAKQVGMSDEGFRSINHIPPRMLVKAGSTVLVPRSANKATDVPEHVADNASLALAHESPPTRRVTVKVGAKGDTVASIAKRHGVSAAAVASWNKVAAGARFAPGTKVVLNVPVKAKGKSTRYAKGKAGKRASKATAAKKRGLKLASKR